MPDWVDDPVVWTAIGTCSLVVVTAVYVWLTRRLAQHAAESAQAAVAQLRIATLPSLFFALVEEDGVVLRIANSGPAPAYDIDAWVFGVLHEDEPEAVQDLQKRLFRQEYRHVEWEPTEEDLYALSDRSMWSVLPPHQEVVVRLNYPTGLCGSYTLLVQFRSATGENYASIVWFFQDQGPRFRLGALDPEVPSPFTRIEYERNPRLDPAMFGGLGAAVELSALASVALPTGWLRDAEVGVEDRGEIRPL